MGAGPILTALPWLLVIAGTGFGLWLGLRLGVRFHAVLENLPLIGVGASVKQSAEVADLRADVKALAEAVAKLLPK